MNTSPEHFSPGRNPGSTPHSLIMDSDRLEHLQAGLVRIVGGRATQALVQRSLELCGSSDVASATLSQTLMQLVTALLGESLAARLQYLGQDAQQDSAATLRKQH